MNKLEKKWLTIPVALAFSVSVKAAEDLPITDGLTLHYDASIPSTLLCNDQGSLTNWIPVTGSVPLVDAATAYPDASFEKKPVAVVTENGRTGLKLSDGHNNDAGGAFTFLAVPNKHFQSFKTMFIVSRQIDSSWYGAIIGHVKGYEYRYTRVNDVAYAWNNDWGGLALVNGCKMNNASGKPCFTSFGGVDMPHVLAAQSKNGKQLQFETVGAGYVVKDDAMTPGTASLVYDKCVVHEVVFYDRSLTEVEMMRVSRHLVRKWNLIDPDPSAVTWSGGGATSAWSDPGNWDGGHMPTPFSTVYLVGDATITLDLPEVTASSITNYSGTAMKLTLEAMSDATLHTQLTAPLSLKKTGEGRLILAGRQCHEGGTEIAAGTLEVRADIGEACLASYGTVSVHVDATQAGSFTTNEDGCVTSWLSSVGNVVLKAPSTSSVFDMASYHHGDPRFATDVIGRSCVRFGVDAANSPTGTFLFATIDDAKINFSARTQFYVQRQRVAKELSGLSGCITNYNSRIYRSTGGDYRFAFNHSVMWTNGRCNSEESVNTFERSAADSPNLLVVRDSSIQSFDIIGGQYLYRTDTSKPNVSIGNFDLYEVVFFEEELTDAQVDAVSRILMDKWGIPAQADLLACDYYPSATPCTIAAGAVLDFSGLSGVKLPPILGEGTVLVGQVADQKSIVTVAGGMVKSKFSAPSYGLVTAHLDASDVSTITSNASGEVLGWSSVDANGVNFTAAPLAVSGVSFHTGFPRVATSVGGLSAVRFGVDAENNFTGTWFKAQNAFAARTIFLVTTERLEKPIKPYLGNLYTYGNRIMRDNSAKYCWKDEVYGASLWANGEAGSAVMTNSALSSACLFVSRRRSAIDTEILGGAWLQNGTGGALTSPEYAFAQSDLHELIVFGSYLSDEQIDKVSAHLMNKWNVPRQAEIDGCVLPRSVVLTGNATMDADSYDYALDSLVVDTAGAAVPKLTVHAPVNVTQARLVFQNLGSVGRSTFIEATNGLTGPFAEVTGLPDTMRIKYTASLADLCVRQGLLLLFK